MCKRGLFCGHVSMCCVKQAQLVFGSALTNFGRLKWYSILLCCFSWRGKCISNYHRKLRRGGSTIGRERWTIPCCRTKQAMSCQAAPEQHAFAFRVGIYPAWWEMWRCSQSCRCSPWPGPLRPAVPCSRRGSCVLPWCYCINCLRASS